jgi:hypothetical protein
MIAMPPSLTGADQLRVMEVSAEVEERDVGALGTAFVVTLLAEAVAPVPTAFVAATENV